MLEEHLLRKINCNLQEDIAVMHLMRHTPPCWRASSALLSGRLGNISPAAQKPLSTKREHKDRMRELRRAEER